MAKIIDFSTFLAEEPDIDAMSRDELLACLEDLREKLAELDRHEPRDMNSEAYESWGDAHEQLEDLADEVQDRLDEMK